MLQNKRICDNTPLPAIIISRYQRKEGTKLQNKRLCENAPLPAVTISLCRGESNQHGRPEDRTHTANNMMEM